MQFHRPTHPDCGGQAKAQPRCHRETTATAPVLDSTVFKRQQPRPRLGAMDKLFLVVARRFWAHWKKALVIVLPDTVVRWHRFGFKLYWAMLCKVRKPGGGGRRISQQIRELIFQMVADNPSWGAPRIHGELRMLGFDVSEKAIFRQRSACTANLSAFIDLPVPPT